jgi:hypothetical protein
MFSACEEIIDPPQQSITSEKANTLEEEYKNTRAGIINDSLNITDTRDFWFKLETLKEYIEYVEQEAEEMGKENLGIRIYLGAYPDNNDYPDPGFTTVFLVPTSQVDVTGLQKGFFPIEPVNQNIDSINALNYGTGGIPPNDY